MSDDIAIKVESLSKVYKLYNAPVDRLKEALHPRKKKYHKDFYALNNVSFEIKKGETVGIIGKNGSGKSTLLKIITGVLTPSDGKVTVNGRISALLELGAGFNPEYSGMENIYFQGNLMGFERTEMENKIQEILEFSDIGEFIHQPVKNYSSGMFARLAFAVAINVEPEILIVDEALSVGDMLFQQKCLFRMKKMMESGVTVCFVSHSLAQVRSLCQKAIYLKNGNLTKQGGSPDVCDLYMNDTTDNGSKDKLSSKAAMEANALISKVPEIKNINESSQLFYINNDFNKVISERSGGGELEFVSFDIYNENYKKITDIFYRDKVNMVISFKVNKNIPAGTAVGIHVTDINGNSLLGLNSNTYNTYLPEYTAGDKGVIVYSFKFPLANVQVIFGLGAKPHPFGNYFYDRIFGAGYLNVTLNNLYLEKNLAGMIYVDDLAINIY